MSEYTVRRGLKSEDEAVAQNFYGMWMDIGTDPNTIRENWKQIVLDKIRDGRKDLKLSTVVIVDDANKKIVGSCVCQVYNTDSLHPDIIKASAYQAGYLWGVFVEPELRNRGLAKRMISVSTDYFKEIGVSEAKLWASDKGKPVYKHEGYQFVTEGIQEMVLSLK